MSTTTTDDLDEPVAAAAERAGVDPTIARALLREDWASVDPLLPTLIDALKQRGAAECWHKHSTFLDHLLGTCRIAVLWGLPREVALCSLLHSAYSNSFVNLALFEPSAEGRRTVEGLAGKDVERWTWLFCRVPRHQLIYDELVDPIVYGIGKKGGEGKEEEENAQRGQKDEAAASCSSSSPPDYSSRFPSTITVRDIRDNSPIPLDAYELGTLLALTILDFSEQWHSWQDTQFAVEADGGGRMRYAGKRAHVLWPGGAHKGPGLYLHTLSEMGRLVVAANAVLEKQGDPRRVPLPRPWHGCSEVVTREAQLKGRDLYWRAVSELSDAGAAEFADRSQEDFRGEGERAEEEDAGAKAERWRRGEEREREAERCLRESAALLPCVGEPRIVLAQLLMQRAVRMGGGGLAGVGGGAGGSGSNGNGSNGNGASTTDADPLWHEAGEMALEGLALLLAWGTSWDKRFPWGAWCAWARVCCVAARDRAWPRNDQPFKVINLGLVR